MIIGIGHVARAGKDTAAEGLVRGLGYARLSFAAPLKELALKADPLITSSTRTVNTQAGHGRLKWTVQGLGGFEAAKDTYPEIRRFLQNLGLGAREVFGENFWVDMALKQAERYENVVFTDVRFTNEADAIKAAGGKVVRIDRPGFVAAGHVSETELLDYDFDHVIVNDGTVVELQQKLVDFARISAKSVNPIDLDVVLAEADRPVTFTVD